MICFGNVPAGSVLPIYFASYGKTNGESITLTGLAVTDIEVYKGTSVTQRASDAGYTLIDTDGIDVDGVTGIHAFSIDTGDNTDAGFYAAGSFYTVVVSAVTIDSQTVNFIAATFRIVAAENTAGTPVADTVRVAGTAQTAGDIIGDTNDIQSRLPAALVGGRMDSSVGAMAAGTVTAAAIATDAIDDDAIAADVTAVIAGAVWNAATASYGTANTYGALVESQLDATVSSRLASAGYTAPLDAAGVRTAVGLAAANLDTQLTAIDDYLDTEVASVLAAVDTEVAAIKAKTDNLPASPAATSDIPSAATIATQVLTSAQTTPIHSDVKKMNGATVLGAGTAGDLWRG